VINLYPYLNNPAIDSIVMFPNGFKAEKLYTVFPRFGFFNASRDLTAYRTVQSTTIPDLKFLSFMGADVPLCDYEYSTCPELFIQKESFNYFGNTADFSAVNWNTNGTITDAYGQGPDLMPFSAARFQDANAYQITDFGGPYLTLSVYAKRNTASTIRLYQDTAEVTYTLSDRWERYTFTTTPGGPCDIGFEVVGDALIWIPQFEEGDFATSPIPNGASINTRPKDIIYKDITGREEFLIYFDVRLRSGANIDNFYEVIGSVNIGDTDYYCAIGVSNTNEFIVNLYNNPDNQLEVFDAYPDGIHKVAVKFTDSVVKVWIDGVNVLESGNVGVSPTALNRLDLGTIAGALNPIKDRIRGCIFMGGAAGTLPTDEEIIELTTITDAAEYMITQGGDFIISESGDYIILEQ
jgi:hypothetical protein